MPDQVTYDESPRPRVLLSKVADRSLVEALVPTIDEMTERGMGAFRAESWAAREA